MSSKETGEEHVMHSNSDDIEIMTDDEADEAITELFESLLSRYRIGLEQRWKIAVLFLIV